MSVINVVFVETDASSTAHELTVVVNDLLFGVYTNRPSQSIEQLKTNLQELVHEYGYSFSTNTVCKHGAAKTSLTSFVMTESLHQELLTELSALLKSWM